jgi:DNA-binding transcriptional MerR regulator
MAQYSIKDLEKLSGIKAHTLRIWEKRYRLVEPHRTETNIRYYEDADLKRILNVAFLNRNGYRISQIAQLEEEEINSKVNDLSRKTSDVENTIDHLLLAMIELNEEKFEKILTDSIMHSGFEETIISIVHPFFERIGVLWQTGAINPAQEHFISNLIRQKIIVAIDSLRPTYNHQSKTFLLYLPEGELHELGLLFNYYLLKKRGHKIIYLGQSVPFEDLNPIVEARSVDVLLTSFASSITGNNLNQYIDRLSKRFKDYKIIFSCFEELPVSRRLPSNVHRVKNSTSLLKLLPEITG